MNFKKFHFKETLLIKVNQTPPRECSCKEAPRCHNYFIPEFEGQTACRICLYNKLFPK